MVDMEAHMDQQRRAVWERYVSAWRATTAAEQQAIFASCLVPDCVYTDPLVQAKGWTELTTYMQDFQRQIPGGHFVTQQFIEHHQRSVAHWKMLNGDAAIVGEGVSYAEYDAQGRLLVMTGFFQTPEG
jgi:hypothetical protein